MTAAAEQPPGRDLDSDVFWTGLAEHRILLQACQACGSHRFPPMPSCPFCASTDFHVGPVSGSGRIYSLVKVHRAFSPEMAASVPYTAAVVELAEQVRVVGIIPGTHAEIGDLVDPVFLDHDGWTELGFERAAP